MAVGYAQPSSIVLQGFGESVSPVALATSTGGSVSDGDPFSKSTNHGLDPIPLSQTF